MFVFRKFLKKYVLFRCQKSIIYKIVWYFFWDKNSWHRKSNLLSNSQTTEVSRSNNLFTPKSNLHFVKKNLPSQNMRKPFPISAPNRAWYESHDKALPIYLFFSTTKKKSYFTFRWDLSPKKYIPLLFHAKFGSAIYSTDFPGEEEFLLREKKEFYLFERLNARRREGYSLYISSQHTNGIYIFW